MLLVASSPNPEVCCMQDIGRVDSCNEFPCRKKEKTKKKKKSAEVGPECINFGLIFTIVGELRSTSGQIWSQAKRVLPS